MAEVQRRGQVLIKEYLPYKRHVCREEYEDFECQESRQMEIEGTWPDYRDSVTLVSSRRYLESDMDGVSFREKYLKEHVQSIQEMKQHHVHTLNSKGERVPLTHCRRTDNPNKCRGDFPRTHWAHRERCGPLSRHHDKNGDERWRKKEQVRFFAWAEE